ncbi:1,4-alpha-glucan branching enzyme [Gramella sp. Hel_I_59]|uniref:alpha-amylase family glycosyl hydrolase n=1 Tax=Gramella sp. Hel_I_59 TaxID=1249978 RepID=UPI00114D97C8|nr:alpha-amylase family glycosyl hydrolase [Gramella sp. Hel_I_59]TQI71412.1 1,4-alpha-glucan branching enzyme [Gramella sp. Hel_I_59]
METIIKRSPGMGCIIDEGLTTFRVWAPNADKIFVTGTFNDWNADDLELEHEENGYWAGTTDKAKQGDEYKYVIHNNGETFYRNDPYAFELTNSDGNSVIRDLNFDFGDDQYQLPSFNQLVIYELHVGTFNRKSADTVGTFENVIEKLDYLKNLGINCIELLPVAEFPGGESWGYNPAHPFAIEQDYGGPNGLANLVKAAHQHGIGVIMDVVYNHFGPSDMDLWQFDGWSQNDKGGIYFYNDHRSKTPWGDTRPDYGREEVRQYLRDNALMWIEKYRCDGLRMDATSYIRFEGGGLGEDTAIEEGNQMMREINAEIQEKYPHIITIAEDLKGHDMVTDTIENGGIGYGSQWDMNFVHPVREVLTDTHDDSRDLEKIAGALQFVQSNDAFKRIIYTESHDEVANGKARVPEEVQPGDAESAFAKKRALLGIVLTLTTPGIPMLFQGQEFMEDSYFQDTVELNWEKLEKHQGISRLVSNLIKIRTGEIEGYEGLRQQAIEIIHLNNDSKVLAYLRGEENSKVLIVINFSNKDYTEYNLDLAEQSNWKLRLNTVAKEYDDDFSEMEVDDPEIHMESKEEANTGTFEIPGYSALIFIHE